MRPGQWQGPVESGYGVHLVFVSERTEGRLPALAEVRDAVRREWDNARRLEANEKLYEAMLKRYVVTIERPQPAEETKSSRRRRQSETRAPHLCSARPLFAPGAFAHEVRPAYLELRQTGPETYDVLWKVPGQGENLRLGLYVELPAGCTNVTQPRGSMVNNAYTERWTVKCAGGLAGGTIHIAGLTATMTDVLVRMERLDGTTQVTRLTPSAPSFVVEAAPRAMEVARTYLVLGIDHILTGIDHLLFVLGLLLIVEQPLEAVQDHHRFHGRAQHHAGRRDARLRQRADAAAERRHRAEHLVPRPEIVRVWRGQTSLTIRYPWVVAFAFGLLHGFGFASGLKATGLPQSGHRVGAVAVQRRGRARAGVFRVCCWRWSVPFAYWKSAGRAGRRRCPAIPSARSARSGPCSAGDSAWGRSDEIRKKSEIGIRNPNDPISQTRFKTPVFNFGHSNLFRVSIFGFRILLCIILFAPAPAFAHIQQGEAAGFLTGFVHPISGLDHVLAMVAVGLWGAQLGAPAIWVLPVAFPLVMAMGGMLGLMGVPVPGIEYGIAASAILLGAAVLFEVRASLFATALLVGVFAIFHGHAHGTELPPGQSALLYSMGFVIATGCLHALGIGIGAVHRWTWGQKLLRAAGAIVLLGGVVFFWRAVS